MPEETAVLNVSIVRFITMDCVFYTMWHKNVKCMILKFPVKRYDISWYVLVISFIYFLSISQDGLELTKETKHTKMQTKWTNSIKSKISFSLRAYYDTEQFKVGLDSIVIYQMRVFILQRTIISSTLQSKLDNTIQFNIKWCRNSQHQVIGNA